MSVFLELLGTAGFTLLVDKIFTLFMDKKKHKSAEQKGIMFSLLFVLQSYGDKIIKKGKITEQEYRQFTEMYQTYKDMDGDGFADKIKEEVEALPRKEG